MSTNNKFLKNETILQTLRRINKQVKSEHLNPIKNTKLNKQTKDNLQENKYLISENTVETSKNSASNVCNNILSKFPDDDNISYQSYQTSNKSYKKGDANSVFGSVSNFSLDNDENSMMFIKIISNLEERLSNIETKKKRKHNS